jgi:hypothetical protein
LVSQNITNVEAIVRLVWLVLLLVAVCGIAGATVFDKVMRPVNCDSSDASVCLVSLFYLE